MRVFRHDVLHKPVAYPRVRTDAATTLRTRAGSLRTDFARVTHSGEAFRRAWSAMVRQVPVDMAARWDAAEGAQLDQVEQGVLRLMELVHGATDLAPGDRDALVADLQALLGKLGTHRATALGQSVPKPPAPADGTASTLDARGRIRADEEDPRAAMERRTANRWRESAGQTDEGAEGSHLDPRERLDLRSELAHRAHGLDAAGMARARADALDRRATQARDPDEQRRYQLEARRERARAEAMR